MDEGWVKRKHQQDEATTMMLASYPSLHTYRGRPIMDDEVKAWAAPSAAKAATKIRTTRMGNICFFGCFSNCCWCFSSRSDRSIMRLSRANEARVSRKREVHFPSYDDTDQTIALRVKSGVLFVCLLACLLVWIRESHERSGEIIIAIFLPSATSLQFRGFRRIPKRRIA